MKKLLFFLITLSIVLVGCTKSPEEEKQEKMLEQATNILKKGQYEEALKIAKKADSIYSDRETKEFIKECKELINSDTSYKIGLQKLSEKDYKAAIKSFKLVKKSDKHNYKNAQSKIDKSSKFLAANVLEQAIQEYEKGDQDKAYKLFKKTVDIDKKSSEALYNIGYIDYENLSKEWVDYKELGRNMEEIQIGELDDVFVIEEKLSMKAAINIQTIEKLKQMEKKLLKIADTVEKAVKYNSKNEIATNLLDVIYQTQELVAKSLEFENTLYNASEELQKANKLIQEDNLARFNTDWKRVGEIRPELESSLQNAENYTMTSEGLKPYLLQSYQELSSQTMTIGIEIPNITGE